MEEERVMTVWVIYSPVYKIRAYKAKREEILTLINFYRWKKTEWRKFRKGVQVDLINNIEIV